MPFVLGLNHRTTSVSLREKLAVAGDELSRLLQRLRESSGSDEQVCLSTCNRTEVYAQAKNRSAARDAITRALEQQAGLPAGQAGTAGLSGHLYYHENEDAVRHLFSVASGLDSMILGEHEILAQVKQAYQSAQQGGFTGKLLNVLFQRSLYVGKRVRTDTGLGEGAASVGSIAVGMAERIFGSLEDRTVMILGAGRWPKRRPGIFWYRKRSRSSLPTVRLSAPAASRRRSAARPCTLKKACAKWPAWIS